MSVSLRLIAGAIVGLGLAVAILLPKGYACEEADAAEVHRQWSYSQERWFHGCWPSQDVIDRGVRFKPMDARTDWRLPLRIGAAAPGLLIAWIVIGHSRRRSTNDGEQQLAPSTTVPTGVVVALSALGGAMVALLLTLRHDPYCILRSRAPGGLSCTYRSFLGWAAEPILVEILFTVVGAAGGAVIGLLAARRTKLAEAARTEIHSASPGRELPT